jgi:hypothetical protein
VCIYLLLFKSFAEIKRVRMALFQFEFNAGPLELPEADGVTVTVSEKVFVPAKEYPDVSLLLFCFYYYFCLFTVQLRWSHTRSARYDSKTIGTGDRM